MNVSTRRQFNPPPYRNSSSPNKNQPVATHGHSPSSSYKSCSGYRPPQRSLVSQVIVFCCFAPAKCNLVSLTNGARHKCVRSLCRLTRYASRAPRSVRDDNLLSSGPPQSPLLSLLSSPNPRSSLLPKLLPLSHLHRPPAPTSPRPNLRSTPEELAKE